MTPEQIAAREVIARAFAGSQSEAPDPDEWWERTGDADPYKECYRRDAGAALTALRSADAATRLALIREMMPEGWVVVRREHIAILYAHARRPDFAEEYTTRDLLADFQAMQKIARTAHAEAAMLAAAQGGETG